METNYVATLQPYALMMDPVASLYPVLKTEIEFMIIIELPVWPFCRGVTLPGDLEHMCLRGDQGGLKS